MMMNMKDFSNPDLNGISIYLTLNPDEGAFLGQEYRIQLVLSIIALFINVIIYAYAYSSRERFCPHVTMFRTMMFIDTLNSIGYLLDAFTTLINKNLMDLENGVVISSEILVPVQKCTSDKPYSFFILLSRQWTAMLTLVMGLERFLFVAYPLWFKVVRVRRTPIVLFTLSFVLLSACIGYTNSLFIQPFEWTFYTCENTWAYGDNYGFFQAGLIIAQQYFGWFFCFYAWCVVRRRNALRHFGSNRIRLQSERRKIRKAIWMISAMTLFNGFPEISIVVLRLISEFGLQRIKIIVSQFFICKCFANIILYFVLDRMGPGIIGLFKKWWIKRRKMRVEPSDSVASVSYYVNNRIGGKFKTNSKNRQLQTRLSRQR
uniref:G-protein coupled receptors family 1 profile domain-containing protein n=1 Tax=Acrobeloides nanus TaxID=290746 RepID=A0A914DTW1_9BILA